MDAYFDEIMQTSFSTTPIFLKVILPNGSTSVVQITEANSVEEIIGLLKTQPTGQVDYFVQLADNTMVPVFEDHIIFNYPDIDKLVIEEKGKPLKEKGGGKGGLSINTTVSKGEEPPGSPSMRLLMKGIKTVRTSLSIKRTGSFSLSAGSEKPSKPKGPSESPPSSAPAVPAPHIPVHGMTTAMKAARVRSSSKVRSRFESLQGHSHESSNRASFIGSAEDPDVTGSTSTLSLSAELESMRDLQIQNTQLQSARSGGHGFDFSFQGIEKIEIGNDLFTPQSGTLPEEFGSNVTPYDIINKERENVFNKFREQFHVGMPWKAPPQLKDMVTPVFEDIPAQGNVYVRYHLGQSNSVVIQVISAITCEKLLQHLCTRHLIDYAAHTFEVKIGQEPQQPAEMNRFVGAICQSQLITDFYIVKKAKQYKTTAIEEFGEPVMNCTTIAGKSVIVSIKKEKMFELMGDPTYRDEEVPNIFFLTYRSFAKAEEFFAFLVKKFYSYPVDNSNEGKQIFEENIDSMRLKILSVFHKWIEHHYHDFGIQAQLRVNLETFLDILVHENGAYAEVAKGIRFVLGIQKDWFDELISPHSEKRKTKRIQSMFEKLEVDDIAQQLCLHNIGIFGNIHAIEFLNEIWKGKDDESSPSFKYFVERFDKESYWAVTEIIGTQDFKARVAVLRKFIYLINALPEKTKLVWAECEKMADPSKNMKTYRDKLASVAPGVPMVPFLPIYLKDLTFMNDGNPSKINGFINFEKLTMMAKSVQEITKLGSFEFPYEKKPEILNYLDKPFIEFDLEKLKAQAAILESQ